MLHDLLHFFGGAICHQLEERSLQASGETLSVCARDTGIYIGIFSTLLYLHLFKRKTGITIPRVKVSLSLLLLMVPLMADGLGSYAGLFESTNPRRLITGISFGYVLPFFLYPLVLGRSLEASSQPVIKQSKDIVFPLFISCVLGGLIFWGKLPYFVVDGLIIVTILGWFSLCASFLFSKLRSIILKWIMSVFASLVFLSTLTLLHRFIIS